MRIRKSLLWFACFMTVLLIASTGFAAEKLAKKQILSFNVGTEPSTLDPAKSTGIPEAIIELNCFEGLTRMDENNVPQPAIAESWTISKDGLVYTFKLRKTKWSNGQPVTAHDFEWAWKRALAPETASEYAYQLWYIKNGRPYNEGKLKDPSKVGVRAVNDYTLQVVLENPTPYFLQLCNFPTLMPVYRKVVEADPEGWFQNPKNYIGNGPYKMVSWQHNSKIELVPNPHYWNRKKVGMERLDLYLVDDIQTALSMFETGQLDWFDAPPAAEIERLEKQGLLHKSEYIGTYYYMFNVTKKPLNDVRVRKALTMAIDRQTLIDRVVRGGQLPALAYVPYGLGDATPDKDFRKIGGDYFKEDLAAAKKLLAEAGYPDGKGFPTLTILYNTSENHKKIAEAIQEMWKKNLGIDVRLTNQEWQVYLDSRTQLNYEVARAGWIGDYLDPMTFLDMWVTGGGNNDTGWGSKKYDELIYAAQAELNTAKRAKMLHDAETILMTEMPIMPIYFYVNLTVIKPWIKGAFRSPLGFIDFSTAYVLEH
ncbi:MAG: peptide ABC transporter substrate-binding protein [Bacillota bacterium]|jgi:oligopeptide transport system substrate-binding protein|nr:peptide ABC transporter substrate-binding protein [Bacillota bacterium]